MAENFTTNLSYGCCCYCIQKFRQQTQSQQQYNHAKVSNIDSFTTSSISSLPSAVVAAATTAADSYNNSGIDNSKDVIEHMAAAGPSNCKQQFASKMAAKHRRQVELYDVAGKVQIYTLGSCVRRACNSLRACAFTFNHSLENFQSTCEMIARNKIVYNIIN